MPPRYQPVASASTPDFPPNHEVDQADRSAPSDPPSRRSFSDIVVPPHLSYPVPDPFAPFQRRADDDASSASSDTAAEGYSDSEQEGRDEKAQLVEGGSELEGNDHWRNRRAAKLRRRRLLFTIFPAVLMFLVLFTFLASHLVSGRHTFHGEGLKKITLAHLANGTFNVDRIELEWLREAGDGVYSKINSDGSISLVDVHSNTTRTLVSGSDIVDASGNRIFWSRFQVSADLKYILVSANTDQQWRHSSHSNFYVYSLENGTTAPLHPPSYPAHTAIAAFSPVNHHIAYVHANDLYVLESPPLSTKPQDPLRITTDGSPTTFNGVPDWVYEEEVFSSDKAVWWAPDGSKLAYISFDEEKVNTYDFPVYNPSPWTPGAEPYPSSTVMRYPKPGFPNPTVSLHVFDLAKYLTLPPPRPSLAGAPSPDSRIAASTYHLSFSKPFPEDDIVITEVTWVGKDDLIVKATNRIASVERVAHFVLGPGNEERGEVVGQVVRETDWKALDGGWVEPGQTTVGIYAEMANAAGTIAPTPSHPPGYLDVLPDAAGFRHIAYFSPPDAKDPIFLTSGEWEVDGSIEAVDIARGLVYFIAANPSIERHLYAVPLPSIASFETLKAGGTAPSVTALSNTTERGYHRTSFSPFAGYYVLSYEGSGVPWQKLVKVDDQAFSQVLTDNAALTKTDSAFMKAKIEYTTVASNGQVLNVAELRPPLMDLSGRTKYPVLFQVYGGPASQMASTAFARDFHHYLCTSLNYVVVKIDPRGTGFKGRQFRVGVRGRLGELEASDTVDAARYYASLPYIDEKRVGIWGWSYGGYLTSKVIETNTSVFTLGMSVAPVTDWRYYDTIYTERYMSTPQLNPEGYRNSSVMKMEGFKHADFALAHGSGDDNVHFLNTAALLDRLTVARVRGFRFRMFTDSDHSISTRGAYWELMTWLGEFLVEKWGHGGTTKQKWKMDAGA